MVLNWDCPLGLPDGLVGNLSEERLKNLSLEMLLADYEDAMMMQGPSGPEHVIQTYMPPVCVVLGTIGNVLLLLVLRRQYFQEISVYVYLRSFVIANLIVLYVILGVEWVCFIAEKRYVADWSDFMCRVWMFVINLVNHIPGWYVCTMMIDRYITLWHHQKAVEICTPFVAQIVVVIVTTGTIAISLHSMWTFELLDVGCFIPSGSEGFHYRAWPWISDTFYYFIPLSVILLAGIMVLLGIACGRVPGERTRTTGKVTQREATITSLALSTTYFLLVAPMCALKIFETFVPNTMLCDAAFVARIKHVRSYINLLGVANHIITVLVVIGSSVEFRGQISTFLSEALVALRHLKRLQQNDATEDFGESEAQPLNKNTSV